ncbi:hypothetical protein [Aeromonas sp. MR7]|uniref:Acb2/Tad1 domain-containing protein n=1 Tax=Aeromonas sp. MR7 TaxID=2923419 RepID=UPI001F4BCA11|nr:hypothetical protein [Aeromonas sp. MR7]MCH7348581.1 hypothetical protein [Aeromonas sp. MR7]
MENQHRQIKGYRELSQEEIDLMNRIKEKGTELLSLHASLVTVIVQQQAAVMVYGSEEDQARFFEAEDLHWAAIGKKDIQTGVMALVRAVAQPAGV